MNVFFRIICIFFFTFYYSLCAVDYWTLGMFIAQPFLNVFVQRIFAKDQKTERDRVNESLAIHLAILNASDASPELKKIALDAIMREEEKSRLLDIKEYLQSAHLNKKEDSELIAWGQKEVVDSAKKNLQAIHKLHK